MGVRQIPHTCAATESSNTKCSTNEDDPRRKFFPFPRFDVATLHFLEPRPGRAPNQKGLDGPECNEGMVQGRGTKIRFCLTLVLPRRLTRRAESAAVSTKHVRINTELHAVMAPLQPLTQKFACKVTSMNARYQFFDIMPKTTKVWQLPGQQPYCHPCSVRFDAGIARHTACDWRSYLLYP